jgi:S-DNA-T family DNA segregation ATPase FtsK/SpoIIIE
LFIGRSFFDGFVLEFYNIFLIKANPAGAKFGKKNYICGENRDVEFNSFIKFCMASVWFVYNRNKIIACLALGGFVVRILLFVLFFLVFFVWVSTLFVDYTFVGKIGEEIGSLNRAYFGFLAFVYPAMLLFFMVYASFMSDGRGELVKKGVALVIFMVSLTVAQAIYIIQQHPQVSSGGYEAVLKATAPKSAQVPVEYPLQTKKQIGAEGGIVSALVGFHVSRYVGIVGLWMIFLMLVGMAYTLWGEPRWLGRVVLEMVESVVEMLNLILEGVVFAVQWLMKKLKEGMGFCGYARGEVEAVRVNEFMEEMFSAQESSSKLPVEQIRHRRGGGYGDGSLRRFAYQEAAQELQTLQNDRQGSLEERGSGADVKVKRRKRPKRSGSITKKGSQNEEVESKSSAQPSKGERELGTLGEIKKVRMVRELEENQKILETMVEKGGQEKEGDGFRLPSVDFLQKPPKKRHEIDEAQIDKMVQELLKKLRQFKIEGDVVRTYTGPLVTTFEFKPAPHIKVSKILGLADDLAMALKARTIRIQAPIPGKDVVGIEIPNSEFETIYLREIIESDIFKKSASPLTLALGKDIVGKPFVTDLKKLPHLLIAGTTGSGKSVGINSMVVSLLYRNSPDRLKLMMIDPKMLEFSIYNDIPHLLTPVITNPKQAVTALSNMVAEMERRYQLMSQYKTKNIDGFNKKAKKEGVEELPYIVVIIDELADLMMTSGKDVEYSIARLAQMARAAGIHLIVATQRPSVDVVTGLIKANLPARISFRVGQKIDSKVILDSFGAESLLGRGDMLFTPPGANGLIRLHAPWVSESEIERIVEFLKSQREPEYDERFLAERIDGGNSGENGGEGDLDELFEEAKEIVLSERKTSISYLQRRLQIGYNRAARIIEQLEHAGILSPPNAKGSREILV